MEDAAGGELFDQMIKDSEANALAESIYTVQVADRVTIVKSDPAWPWDAGKKTGGEGSHSGVR